MAAAIEFGLDGLTKVRMGIMNNNKSTLDNNNNVQYSPIQCICTSVSSLSLSLSPLSLFPSPFLPLSLSLPLPPSLSIYLSLPPSLSVSLSLSLSPPSLSSFVLGSCVIPLNVLQFVNSFKQPLPTNRPHCRKNVFYLLKSTLKYVHES